MVYKIDSLHSRIGFSVRHFGISTVRGRFATFSGQVEVQPENPSQARVEIDINAASIDTGQSDRDSHLRGPDFLHVEEYPHITFASTHIDSLGEGIYTVRGDLTLHGK